MKLRNIEILGFKSFRFKTVIEIGDGITSVVGPNGCGKSNVVDAIRWAMGSQSPRDLRGKAMEDVIFAGSERHAPVGFAEVSLAFDNSQPPPDMLLEWRELTDIKVTRRLYRNGDSDYEINGNRVRLRDIHSVFTGTGINPKEAYSIIEQGRIGYVVSARPDERRTMIEEAAGITRYRYQRKAAERRLDKTKENLLRVGDVLREVSRHLSSLERQARKAARYREISQRKRTLEIVVALHRRQSAEAAMAAVAGNLEAARVLHEAAATEFAAKETALEAARTNTALVERQSAEATEEAYRTRTRTELMRTNVTHLEREAQLTREAIAEAQTRLEAESATHGESEAELKRIEAELQSIVDERAESESSLKSAEAALAEIHRRAREIENEIQATLTRVAEAEGAAARAHGRLESIANEIEALESRGEELIAERERRVELRDLAKVAHTTAAARAAETAAIDEDAQQKFAEAQVAERSGVEALEAARSAARAARASEHELSAQVSSLERTLRSDASFDSGVRELLLRAAEGDFGGPLRPLAERLRVSAEDAFLLPLALMELSDALVSDDDEVAASALRHARAAGVGVTVVSSEGGTEGRLSDWCEAVAPVPALIAERIAALSVVDDVLMSTAVPAADRLRSARPSESVLRSAGKAGAAEEIASMQARLEALQAEHAEAASALGRHQGDVVRLEDELESALQLRLALREAADAARGAAETAAGEARRLEAEAQHSEELVRRALRDSTELEERQASLTVEVERCRTEAAAASEVVVDSGRSVGELRATLEGVTAGLREQQASTTELRVRAAGLQERESARRETLERMRRELRRSVERSTQLTQQKGEGTERVEQLAEQIEREKAQLGESIRQADAAEMAAATLRTTWEEADRLMRETEMHTASSRQQAAEKLDALRRAELESERARGELERADEQLAERFQLTVERAREEAGDIEWHDELRVEVRTLQDKLERIGPVNPAAEEEFTEARERHEFLTTQRADLESAIADLESAIKKMDQTSRELFETTYHAVNKGFQEMFPRLFNGGRARMELTDPNDMLATGIEIVVQPPGKRLQTMTLLSGGEKALTAVALVFSIFQLKPTPICILDEVDAPLDDANVGRFADMVREISARSQFLIVTHNTRTMENADTLYGVTMEEPGVSKLVGVKLREGRSPAIA